LRKILSVDDDPKVLAAFQAALKQRGYEVFITTKPDEVTRILNEHDIDLVMLDIRMPEKDGFQIFQELKKKYEKIPALFITAYPKSFTMHSQGMIDMWTKSFADGNTDIMYKPFTLDLLYEKVEGLIGPPDDKGE